MINHISRPDPAMIERTARALVWAIEARGGTDLWSDPVWDRKMIRCYRGLKSAIRKNDVWFEMWQGSKDD